MVWYRKVIHGERGHVHRKLGLTSDTALELQPVGVDGLADDPIGASTEFRRNRGDCKCSRGHDHSRHHGFFATKFRPTMSTNIYKLKTDDSNSLLDP